MLVALLFVVVVSSLLLSLMLHVLYVVVSGVAVVDVVACAVVDVVVSVVVALKLSVSIHDAVMLVLLLILLLFAVLSLEPIRPRGSTTKCPCCVASIPRSFLTPASFRHPKKSKSGADYGFGLVHTCPRGGQHPFAGVPHDFGASLPFAGVPHPCMLLCCCCGSNRA
jgi:hypothetical protein